MIDGADILDIEKRLTAALLDLRRRVEAVAMARQIKEYASDQRKNLLAQYKIKHRGESESDAGQETLARADAEYQRELDEMANQYRKAEKHIAAWDAAYARFDASRSLLSMARAQLPAAMRQSSES
jgi:hypothetical protein